MRCAQKLAEGFSAQRSIIIYAIFVAVSRKMPDIFGSAQAWLSEGAGQEPIIALGNADYRHFEGASRGNSALVRLVRSDTHTRIVIDGDVNCAERQAADHKKDEPLGLEPFRAFIGQSVKPTAGKQQHNCQDYTPSVMARNC